MNAYELEQFDCVISYLMNFCYDNGIAVVYDSTLPSEAISKSYPGNLIVVNGNWKPKSEVPFIFAHEIGHVIENTPVFNNLSVLGKCKGENSANLFAIRILFDYCCQEGIYFDEITTFAKCFGIPRDMYYLLPQLTTELNKVPAL